MYVEYHRPDSLEIALELLARPAPQTLPLAGGTVLAAQTAADPFAVVDLQNLGLGAIRQQGSAFEIGAAAHLETLLTAPGIQPELSRVIRLEANHNLRQQASVAGTLVSADGRSPFAAAMLALDAQLTLLPGDTVVPLGDLFNARTSILPGRLITALSIQRRASLAYESVARTPADRPILAVAIARWPSGRLRVVVGGFGHAPRLALDAPEPGGVPFAVESVCANATDAWASAEYRLAVGPVLARRALETLEKM